MDIQRNRAASSSGAASKTQKTSHDVVVDESRRRALETESRVLGAFPWARQLSPSQRTRFADELSNHPTEMTNTDLEALLVSWRAAADAAQRERRAA